MKKIIVVDSGIDKTLLQSCPDLLLKNYTCEKYDMHGHGTASYSLINELTVDCEIKTIKVLNKYLECSTEILINALKFLQNVDCDIINMSLATTMEKDFEEIDSLCKIIHSQGKIIVSSLANSGEISYPAYSKYVIGVEGKALNNSLDYIYNNEGNIQFIADKTPVVVQTLDGYYDLYGGNSKATCCVTALISQNIGHSFNNYMISHKKNIYAKDYEFDKLYRRILKILSKYSINIHNFDIINNIRRDEFKLFLQDLSYDIGISYKKHIFSIYDFSNVYNLVCKIMYIKSDEEKNDF